VIARQLPPSAAAVEPRQCVHSCFERRNVLAVRR
jgi:hypothetical protein